MSVVRTCRPRGLNGLLTPLVVVPLTAPSILRATKRLVATALLAVVSAGCDKMQQQGPPPSYRSSALEAVMPTTPPEQAAPASEVAPSSVPAASSAAPSRVPAERK
jgi:hypothetical protein